VAEGGRVSFEVSADAYLRFMGRYSEPLAVRFADLAGAYLAALTPDRRSELRERCRRLLPAGPVEISATAWAATCHV